MNNTQKKVFERNLTEKMVTNILKVWEVAKSRQLHHTQWYRDAFSTLVELSGEYGLPVHDVAWVCATLSPNLRWDKNIHATISFLDEWFGRKRQYVQNAYGPQVYKCELYMAGELSGLPTGRKVRAFYRNLLGDYSVLTVDRHCGRIALQGVRDIEKPTGDVVLGEIEYRCCVAAHRVVSAILGYSVAEIQAITWQVFNQ